MIVIVLIFRLLRMIFVLLTNILLVTSLISLLSNSLTEVRDPSNQLIPVVLPPPPPTHHPPRLCTNQNHPKQNSCIVASTLELPYNIVICNMTAGPRWTYGLTPNTR